MREQHESFQSSVSSELWAIVSAAAWAAASILVRKGTAFSNPSTAALISFSVNAAVLVLYIIYQYPAEKIFQSANLFFVLSGIIQPTVVRVTFYVGIVRLGVSRAGPIRGTSPFFSVAIAFFLFRERPELIVYLGGYRRHMGGVIQTGWRSPVARHRSCVAPGCSLEKTVERSIAKACRSMAAPQSSR